jgi:hypothetical protein
MEAIGSSESVIPIKVQSDASLKTVSFNRRPENLNFTDFWCSGYEKTHLHLVRRSILSGGVPLPL